MSDTYACKQCGAMFTVARSNGYRKPRQFCGQKCMGLAARRRVDRKCQVCGKAFTVHAAWAKKPGAGKYCSRKCTNTARRRA